jgi:hypothetical protein
MLWAKTEGFVKNQGLVGAAATEDGSDHRMSMHVPSQFGSYHKSDKGPLSGNRQDPKIGKNHTN